jgi:hypothetical protein
VLAPLPSRTTVLPGVVGCRVTASETMKLLPLVGWYVPAARSIVFPGAAFESAVGRVHASDESAQLPPPIAVGAA